MKLALAFNLDLRKAKKIPCRSGFWRCDLTPVKTLTNKSPPQPPVKSFWEFQLIITVPWVHGRWDVARGEALLAARVVFDLKLRG